LAVVALGKAAAFRAKLGIAKSFLWRSKDFVFARLNRKPFWILEF